MTALNLVYYLMMLLGMLAAIWKYVIMEPAVSTDPSRRRLRTGLPLLGAFMGVNFLAEFIVTFVLSPVAYNHFIYTLCACCSAVLMLSFFSLLAPGRLMKVYTVLVLGYIFQFAISHTVWQPGTVIPRAAVVGYFGMMATGSAIFALSCRRSFWGSMRRQVLFLGSTSIVYYLLASVALYFMTGTVTYSKKAYHNEMIAVNLSIALLYYSGIFFTVVRIPDKADAVPALQRQRLEGERVR